MRRRQGPSKKMAPASAGERACAHTFKEDEGLQLEVDCTQCNGAHDLANRKCLTGVMNALVAISVPESIVLRRYIDKRYRGGVVSLVAGGAAELSSLNRLLSTNPSPSDKRCRTCLANRTGVITGAKRALLEDPIAYLEGSQEVRRDLQERMLASAGKCVDAGECIGESLKGTKLEQEGGLPVQ